MIQENFEANRDEDSEEDLNLDKESKVEQTKEEILEVLTEAIEKGREVILIQEKKDGTLVHSVAEPMSINGNFLLAESDGFGFDIKINTIKKIEII